MATTWRRRATKPPSSRVAASGSGLTAGAVAAAKPAVTAASIGSVLARRPSARAKARTWAGFTTTTGNPAAPSVAATTASRPPVASTATARGDSAASRSASPSRPVASRGTAKPSPPGSTWTSRLPFDTSMPTTTASIRSRPCTTGLRERPTRLSGVDGKAGGEPS